MGDNSWALQLWSSLHYFQAAPQVKEFPPGSYGALGLLKIHIIYIILERAESFASGMFRGLSETCELFICFQTSYVSMGCQPNCVQWEKTDFPVPTPSPRSSHIPELVTFPLVVAVYWKWESWLVPEVFRPCKNSPQSPREKSFMENKN